MCGSRAPTTASCSRHVWQQQRSNSAGLPAAERPKPPRAITPALFFLPGAPQVQADLRFIRTSIFATGYSLRFVRIEDIR